MNLLQAHLDHHPSLLTHADWELKHFIGFLNQAKEVIADQTLDFLVQPVPCEKAEDKSERYCYQVLLDDLPDRAQRVIEKVLFEDEKTRLYDEPAATRSRKQIKPINRNAEEQTLTFEQELSGNRLYLQPNDYQINKQLAALRTLKDAPLPHHRELLSLFSFQHKAFPPVESVDQVEDWKVLTDASRDGTPEQRQFVEQALSTPDFAMLEGPPGSGKTTAIIELVIQLALRGKRVLLCSATHVAIDNVIGRILGRYALSCREQIVPVRIATNQSDIREEAVRPYRLQALIQTKKKALKRALEQQNPLSPSQQYLHGNLFKEDDRHLSRLILDSANLVGGTTIGILQHPDLRGGSTQVEPFDYLVIDEASKVPFQEFLVPALHARKWILVGDIHQLSPYVEDSYVSHALAQALPESDQPRVMAAAEIKRRLRQPHAQRPLVVFGSEASADDFPEEVVCPLPDDWKPAPSALLALQAADVILCPDKPQLRRGMAEHLYVKAEFLQPEKSRDFASPLQNHWHRKRKPSKRNESPWYRYLHSWDAESSWADYLAGKLNQHFGRRDDAKLAAFTRQEVDDLLPNDEARAAVQNLSRVVFPSVLEMLQRGVGRSSRQERDESFVIQDGMSENSKRDRFTTLTYQHRMHPAIAETSALHFYSESGNLQPANSVAEDKTDRAWGYKPAEQRVSWRWGGNLSKPESKRQHELKRQNRIINLNEVKAIERELTSFRQWADQTPVPPAWDRETGRYEVAVLTFYRAQEAELRSMLRQMTGQHRRFRNFDLGQRIQLTLCTVDQFQGQEADLVLLSFAKYTKGAHYHSPNRLNVALTRARHKLILFGNQEWMAEKAGLEALNFLGKEFSHIKTY